MLYGESYHIHLYTSGIYFLRDRSLIDKLYDTGLDELRVHPKNLKSTGVRELTREIKAEYPAWSIGFEMPSIPYRALDLVDLIRFADSHGLDFVNLNEFEFTDINYGTLREWGFVSVLHNSAVRDSKEAALEAFVAVKDDTEIPLHFCSSGSKDGIQLKQRYRRRAKSVKRPFEFVSEDGLLEFARLTVFDSKSFDLLIRMLEKLEIPSDYYAAKPDMLCVDIVDVIAVEIIDELRKNRKFVVT